MADNQDRSSSSSRASSIEQQVVDLLPQIGENVRLIRESQQEQHAKMQNALQRLKRSTQMQLNNAVQQIELNRQQYKEEIDRMMEIIRLLVLSERQQPVQPYPNVQQVSVAQQLAAQQQHMFQQQQAMALLGIPPFAAHPAAHVAQNAPPVAPTAPHAVQQAVPAPQPIRPVAPPAPAPQVLQPAAPAPQPLRPVAQPAPAPQVHQQAAPRPQLFQPAAQPAVFLHHQAPKLESAHDYDDVEEEYEPNVHYEPVIPLPPLVEKITGEEQEIELFVNRCKMYRYDKTTKENKERGVGDIKHRTQDACRVVMRRDIIHNVCANFRISTDTKLALKPNTSGIYTVICKDFSDPDEVNGLDEVFTFKFKTDDIAKKFADIFNDASGVDA